MQGPTSGGYSRDLTVGLDSWRFWWAFNRERFMKLKRRLHRVAPVSGSDEFFLGIVNGLFGIDDRTGFGPIAMEYAVRCPGDCDVSIEKGVGEKCDCGETLVQGKFLGFVKVDFDKIPDRPVPKPAEG